METRKHERGKGKKPRLICPECGKDLYNSYCHKSKFGKQTMIKTGLQCACGYHENDEEGMEKLR
jgi:C4-type Zn-finger protein